MKDRDSAQPATGLLRAIPNTVSAFRILGVPLWIVLLARCEAAALSGDDLGVWRLAAVSMLLAIGASDLIDGFIARRYRVASRTGALLDAIADGLVQLGGLAFFSLAAQAAFPPVPVWYFALMLIRALILTGGALLMKALHERTPLEHEWHGKLAGFANFLLLVWVASGLPARVVTLGATAITVFVVASTAVYVRAGWRAHKASRRAA